MKKIQFIFIFCGIIQIFNVLSKAPMQGRELPEGGQNDRPAVSMACKLKGTETKEIIYELHFYCAEFP